MRGHFTDTYMLSTFAGAKHRTLVDSQVRQHDAAPHRDEVQAGVQITAHTQTVNSEEFQSAPATPSAKEKGGMGFNPDYDTTAHL